MQLGGWKERFSTLAPFKDEVIRVGCRLKHSPLSYDSNHPVLLPKEHATSKLVIKEAHNQVCHAGQNLLQNPKKVLDPSWTKPS